jgi:hypothetical protein
LQNFKRVLVATAALALGGCSNLVDFSSWSAGYDKAIERTYNQNLLLNMVRASQNQPLHFTTVAVVRGNGQISPSLTLIGDFPFRRFTDWARNGAQLDNAGVGLSASGGFNFDMASLDNAEFVAGLLTPIRPATVNFYVGQGIPRELLFNLLIERISVTDAGRTDTYLNDPTRPDFAQFQAVLSNLLELGLTTEDRSRMVPFGPPLSAADARNTEHLAAAAKAGLLISPAPGGTYQLMSPVVNARFCFDKPQGAPALPPGALCRGDKEADSSAGDQAGEHKMAGGSAIAGYQNASMTITIRSARNVFNYLGSLIYLQATNSSEARVVLRTQEARDYNFLKQGDELFVVRKNNSREDDLVKVEYRGDTYSIPYEKQGNSALVFNIAGQIVTLNKSINLIPNTSAVIVR